MQQRGEICVGPRKHQKRVPPENLSDESHETVFCEPFAMRSSEHASDEPLICFLQSIRASAGQSLMGKSRQAFRSEPFVTAIGSNVYRLGRPKLGGHDEEGPKTFPRISALQMAEHDRSVQRTASRLNATRRDCDTMVELTATTCATSYESRSVLM